MNNQVRWRMIVLALLSCHCSLIDSVMANGNQGSVDEEIWALEEAYFANLYRADYDRVIALVHRQFLGWPGTLSQPIDREASIRFMKQLISGPTSCSVKVERGGIQVLDAVALTQYTLHVTCPTAGDAPKVQSSRITHTWVKERASWKLLGGMSSDK